MDNNVDILFLHQLFNTKKRALEELLNQSNKKPKSNVPLQFIQSGSLFSELDTISSNSLMSSFCTADVGNRTSLLSNLSYNEFNGYHLLYKLIDNDQTIHYCNNFLQDHIHPNLLEMRLMDTSTPGSLGFEVNRNNQEQQLTVTQNFHFENDCQPSHNLNSISRLLHQPNQEQIISSTLSQQLSSQQITQVIGLQALLYSFPYLGMLPRSYGMEAVLNAKSPWLSSTTRNDYEANLLSEACTNCSTSHQPLIQTPPSPTQVDDNATEMKKIVCRFSYLPQIIAQPEDEAHLSKIQYFLRKQIEVFEASIEDTTTYTRGRNKPIKIGQVGIRCIHCAHLPVSQRQRGSTYFPATLWGLYQASQNMSSTHIQCGFCKEMPESVKDHFASLLCNKSMRLGGGRPYWAHSAARIGLIDTENGIVVKRDLIRDNTISE